MEVCGKMVLMVTLWVSVYKLPITFCIKPVKDFEALNYQYMKHLNRITNLRNPLKPLLVLCGVSGSLQPLTINNVSKMLDKVSKETWIAVQGDERGWKEWWKNRNKLYLNSNDR